MSKSCLIINPISNANIMVEFLLNKGVDCYAYMDIDAISTKPDISDGKINEFNIELYKHTFCGLDELPPTHECIFDAVIPGSEHGVALADIVSNMYGLRGNSPNKTDNWRNKNIMQLSLKNSNMNYIEHVTVSNKSEIADIMGRWNTFPCIVKPMSSAGSEGVVMCNDRNDLFTSLQEANWGGVSATWTINNDFSIQEHISGHEYVVDLVVIDGHASPASLCRYIKGSEIGMTSLPFFKKFTIILDPASEKHSHITNYAVDACKALEIQNGTVHMELIDSPTKGVVMIEAATRLHGTITPSLFSHCYTPDILNQIYSLFFHDQIFIETPKLIKFGVVSCFASGLAGVLDEEQFNNVISSDNYKTLIGIQRNITFNEGFQKTVDLLTVPLCAAFASESATELWEELFNFEGRLGSIFGCAPITKELQSLIIEEFKKEIF